MKRHFFPFLAPLTLFVFFLAGCTVAQPSGDRVVLPQNASDESDFPDAKESETVELRDGDTYNLTVSYVVKEVNGRKKKMLAYNGSIPGPLLKIPQNGEVTIRLRNNSDIPTSLHSHGVRLDNRFDGVVDQLQKPVQPGETFTYTIKFSDAGMFWYHPHLYESYTQQHGLYGNYWVIPENPDFWSPVNEEVPLMLNDFPLEEGFSDEFDPKSSDFALMGRFGDVMFVNGVTDYARTFKKGEVVRFYITNASNTRVFNLVIPDAKMKLVGGDNGKYERETQQESVIVSPSERAIVEVLFDTAGTRVLQNVNPFRTYDLAIFTVSDEVVDRSHEREFMTLRENQDVISDIDGFRPDFDGKPDKAVTFTVDMGGMMGGMGDHMMSGMEGHDMGMMADVTDSALAPAASQSLDIQEKIEWEDSMAMMNAMSTTDMVQWKIVEDVTGREGMDIGWKFKVGDRVKVKLFNDPDSAHPMQHPFHLHGQRFLVLTSNGVKNTNLVWKDTVLVPSGDTVEILVDMQNPGLWMAHCHISEHLESGMMLSFDVEA